MINANISIRNKISKKILRKKFIEKFSKDFEKKIKTFKTKINDNFDILNLFSKNFKFNFSLTKIKKFKKFKTIVIIGMGGSILGAQAIQHFLSNKIKKKIYFFDDINIDKIHELKKNENLDKTLFITISKSGNTIETISNFLSLKIINRKLKKNIIVISEKRNNLLYDLAKKYKLFFIEHKNFIGGRYSVLSEVGIVPAFLMGANVKKLRKNLTKYFENNEKTFLKQSSIFLTELLSQGKIKNIVFLNYYPKLEKFLFWCQQLIAESLGKKNKGFFPVVSNVPKDHHSLLQLYLDGPKDKIFYIFSFKEKSRVQIKTRQISKKITYLNNKSLEKIKHAQKDALISSFEKNNIPFREFLIKKNDEETLSELFAYFMLETITVGSLFKINPFNQPAVEQVKKLTKEFLIKRPKKNF